MSEKARQPAAHLPVEAVHTDAEGNIQQHGIPVHGTDEEPAALPTSARHQTETAPHLDGGDTNVAKHDHNPVGK